MNEEFVPEDARASLQRQQTALQYAPQHDADFEKYALVRALAEFSLPDDPIDAIRHFKNCVYSGVTPPPNILVVIAERFASYLSSSGDSTLDVAFSLKSRQGSGSPLKSRLKKEERGAILYRMWQMRASAEAAGKKLSIEAAASELINEFNLDESEDTLTKAYSQANADEIFGKAHLIAQETFMRKR